MNNCFKVFCVECNWSQGDFVEKFEVLCQSVNVIEIGCYDLLLLFVFKIVELFNFFIEVIFISLIKEI